MMILQVRSRPIYFRKLRKKGYQQYYPSETTNPSVDAAVRRTIELQRGYGIVYDFQTARVPLFEP